MKISFLLNWYANPCHMPIIVAKEQGFYRDLGIELALLEPHDPSDVTHIIGKGEIPIGLKAMVHCYAARSRGYPIVSIGTLLDEPPTGLIYPAHKKIENITNIQGKRLGYVGEFGKVMIDQLASEAGISANQYETVKIGMYAANAILSNKVDAAIGLSCFQQIEIESQGMKTGLLRIDELAHLGCCCFCSILFITHEKVIQQDPEMLKAFMEATKLGMKLTREKPQEALACLLSKQSKKNHDLYEKIFYNTLPYFSRDLLNIDRDWKKVGLYAEKLKLISADTSYQNCFTNHFVENEICTVC